HRRRASRSAPPTGESWRSYASSRGIAATARRVNALAARVVARYPPGGNLSGALPMSEPSIDVIAVGNAIVDVMAPSSDELIAELGLVRGGMTLVDTDQARKLY